MRLVNLRPGRPLGLVLAALPFLAVAAVYAAASAARLAVNPSDRLLPAPSTLWDAAIRLTTEPNRRTGEITFWIDTAASLERLGLGIAIAAGLGVGLGLLVGLLPHARKLLGSFVNAVSMVPPLAILPILFLLLGLGETSKIALIVIGIAPFLVRDLAQRVAEIPAELMVKAQTLGASSLVIALRVALPLMLPRLFTGLRLSLGPGWLFLIAAEAIAAEAGLGYRIFLVRRYLAMDVILVYVVWITLLAVLADWALRVAARRLCPWAGAEAA